MINRMITRRSVLSLLCISPFLYSQRLDKERIWQDFLKWLKDAPIGEISNPYDFRKYRTKLLADGLPAEQVSQRLSVIYECMLSRNEGMALWFNKTYASGNDFFSRRPNAFLIQSIRDLTPGTALDVSMGEGRNSVYLAQQGWTVSGFDISDEGLSIARQNAKKAGVTIETILSGYQEFDYGKSRWDLVALFYAFFPIRNETYIKKLEDSIRPGGVLVFENHLFEGPPDQLDTMGMIGMPTQNELLKIFSRFRVLRYEETKAIPDWAFDKPSPLVRLLAQKR